MKTLTINLPDFVDVNAEEATMLLAAKLYQQGKLSLGQAAEFAGHDKRSFMGLLGRYGVSIINYDSSELENDIKNAGHYHI